MDTRQSGVADGILLSYRAVDAGEEDWELAESDWIRDRVRKPSYTNYLKRVHEGPVAAGDEWEEFVNCGCSSSEDVVVRVERVEGGDRLGMATAVEVVHRRDVVEGAQA